MLERRVDLAGLTLPIGSWVVLTGLPLVLLAVLLMLGAEALASRGDAARAAAANVALQDAWGELRAGVLAEGAGEGAGEPAVVERLREVEQAWPSVEGARSRSRLALWLPPVLVIGALLLCYRVFRTLVRLQGERRALDTGRDRHRQAAILTLLDEIAPLADGDLTVRATVDEAMTGALADAFNQAVESLRGLVRETDRSAAAVRSAVGDTRGSTHALSAAASVQSRELLRASNYLNALSGATARLSLNAHESAGKAGAVRAAVGEGRASLLDAGKQLDRIRDEAALTMRLTHRLADNVRAIDAEVETVQAIARQSELLSLNTTVRASATASGSTSASTSHPATSAASDYARLADDVSDLARALGGASREIVALTGVIRDDAEETLRAMRHSDTALQTGVNGAADLYASLETIDADAADLDRLIGDTAARAARQADVVRRLSDNVAVLHRLGRDGATGLSTTGASLDRLHALADALEASVAGFRLPGGGATARRRAAGSGASRPSDALSSHG